MHTDAFDFACATPVRGLDVNVAAQGEVTDQFVDFTPASNQALIEASFSDIRSHLPTGLEQRVTRYPETTYCQAP